MWRAEGNTLFRGIADGEDGDEVVVCHLRECFLQLRCIEMSDPRRAQPLVVDGKHDVGRDDGGVHVGEIATIVLPYPSVVCAAADNEKDARTEGIVRRLCELCTSLGAFDRPDFERLLVDRRGGDACCLKDAVE